MMVSDISLGYLEWLQIFTVNESDTHEEQNCAYVSPHNTNRIACDATLLQEYPSRSDLCSHSFFFWEKEALHKFGLRAYKCYGYYYYLIYF